MNAGKKTLSETTPLSAGAVEQIERVRSSKRQVLLLVYHREGVETVPLISDVPVVVGRTPPADVTIADTSLSRCHARFTLSEGFVVVEDLGSMNGTRVAGQAVERAVMQPGDDVLLGTVTASVRLIASGGASALGLDGHDTFRGALEQEVARARFFQRTLVVMMVGPPRRQPSPLPQWCPRVRELLRPVDRAALYGNDIIEILLPEASREQGIELAQAMISRRPGEPPLVCGVASFPDSATSIDELIEVSREALRGATPNAPVSVARAETPQSWVRDRRASLANANDAIIMESPAMRAIVELAERLARSSIPVLLQGETGTGKEVLSRLIHERGPRANKPLICVNCGAIPANLVESTLFGHEKGAFTSASQQQKGVFETADGGTVLLDEIGELPAGAQAVLLRVLESKRLTRVGSTKEIVVDVRVIAATNRDLEAMSEARSFRADLFFRLNAMTLTIPPLRARQEDIAPLVTRFLKQANEANEQARTIAPEARSLLEAYSWPGNIRELRNAIERAVVIAADDIISERDFPEGIRLGKGAGRGTGADLPTTGSLKERMERFERDVIVSALREVSSKQLEAAKLLDVPLRTLQYRIKLLGIRKLGYGSGDPEDDA